MKVTDSVTRCQWCNGPCDGPLIISDSAQRIYCSGAHRNAQLRTELEMRMSRMRAAARLMGVRR